MTSPTLPFASAQQRQRTTNHLARIVLATFIFTFVTARVLVIFIMRGTLPAWLFFHAKGTHVHHLNYGIFLLSGVGAYLIFGRPSGKALSFTAMVYAVGLALTFDEFGMWLHLGGPYWQRASYDAVVTIGAFLALIAYGSSIRNWRPRHAITAIVLLIVVGAFGFLLIKSTRWARNHYGPELYQLEEQGPK